MNAAWVAKIVIPNLSQQVSNDECTDITTGDADCEANTNCSYCSHTGRSDGCFTKDTAKDLVGSDPGYSCSGNSE